MKISKLISDLSSIKEVIEDKYPQIDFHSKEVHSNYKLSAKNLYDYLLLRTFDLRKYHDSLSDIGISSIRASQAYVYSNLTNVIRNLKLISGDIDYNQPKDFENSFESISYKKSKKLLKKTPIGSLNVSKKSILPKLW